MSLFATRGASLGRKLAISFGAILAVVAVLSFSSWRSIGSVGGKLEAVAGTSTTETGLIGDVSEAFQDMHDHAKRSQLAHAIQHLEQGSATGVCSSCHTVEAPDKDRAEMDEAGERVQSYVAALRSMMTSADGLRALDQIEKDAAETRRLYGQYVAEMGAGRFESGHAIVTEQLLPLRKNIDTAAAQLVTAHRTGLEGMAQEGRQTGSRSRWLVLGLIGLAALVTVGVVITLRRTSRGLHQITVDLGQSARQVAGMAGEVSAGSQSAAQGASEQAAKLREVTASGAEVNDTAHRNAEKAGLSAELSKEFSHSLTDANQRLMQLLTAMGEIQQTSERVANIVRLIDGVAFQTNILSLNAAVEAARAGESGLGFAVVASEVRNLAQRSADAARETAGLIDEAIAAARNGMERLEGVSAAFQSLTEGAGRVAALAGELRTGSLEQARQMEQITERIDQIQSLTESASTVAEEGARAGESLNSEADGLTHMVSRLVTVVDGSHAAETTCGMRS
jgi:hypothetical protein